MLDSLTHVCFIFIKASFWIVLLKASLLGTFLSTIISDFVFLVDCGISLLTRLSSKTKLSTYLIRYIELTFAFIISFNLMLPGWLFEWVGDSMFIIPLSDCSSASGVLLKPGFERIVFCWWYLSYIIGADGRLGLCTQELIFVCSQLFVVFKGEPYFRWFFISFWWSLSNTLPI